MKDTKLNHWWNLLTGKIKVSKPAKITWANIKAVLQAWIRLKRQIAGFDLDNHIYEQIIWRRTEVKEKSPKCWKKDYCTVCGCDILGKTMEDRACSRDENPCYPEMMTASEWELYKINNQIKFFN